LKDEGLEISVALIILNHLAVSPHSPEKREEDNGYWQRRGRKGREREKKYTSYVSVQEGTEVHKRSGG